MPCQLLEVTAATAIFSRCLLWQHPLPGQGQAHVRVPAHSISFAPTVISTISSTATEPNENVLTGVRHSHHSSLDVVPDASRSTPSLRSRELFPASIWITNSPIWLPEIIHIPCPLAMTFFFPSRIKILKYNVTRTGCAPRTHPYSASNQASRYTTYTVTNTVHALNEHNSRQNNRWSSVKMHSNG